MRYLTILLAVLALSFSSYAAAPVTGVAYIGKISKPADNFRGGDVRIYRITDKTTGTVCIALDAGYFQNSPSISCVKDNR